MNRQVSQGAKVFVGLSGGVDSAVSAVLLQKSGYDVTGVFIKIWSPEWIECTSREDRLDAMRVCAHLGIPFREIDLTEEYKREVVDYMISEYAKGRTPNPDVTCNKTIKFGKYFDWALSQGADFVATGHYAQTRPAKNGTFQLVASRDSAKDQTYFLWMLTQKHLMRTLFPIGGLLKSDVRGLARKFKLPNAGKKDSQGLCFVGQVDIKEFLSRYISKKRGDVLNEQGNIIGYHNGAHLLTVGERHGFTVTKKTPREHALYIAKKDIRRNTVTAVPKYKLYDISYSAVSLANVNWISGQGIGGATTREAQIRYHGQHYRCRITGNSARFIDVPEAIAFGQSLVLYDKDICLGGGIMELSAV